MTGMALQQLTEVHLCPPCSNRTLALSSGDVKQVLKTQMLPVLVSLKVAISTYGFFHLVKLEIPVLIGSIFGFGGGRMTGLCSHPVLSPEQSYQILVANLVLRRKQDVSSPNTEERGCWATKLPPQREANCETHCCETQKQRAPRNHGHVPQGNPS